jgi:integrase
MPRSRQSGDGGLYFDKKRKLWIGVVDNGYTPEGKRIQIRRTSKSQSVARQKLEQLKAEIATTGSPLGNQKVAEWGAAWLLTLIVKKPATYRAYKSIFDTWIDPAIGRKFVKDVRPSDLQRIYADMRAADKAGSTVLKAHNVMSGMFEAARLERLTPLNVTKSVRPPKALKSSRDTFTPEETLRLLAAASRTPDGSKWAVSLYAGIRQGERLGATVDSVDARRGLFKVQWNLVEAVFEHGCRGTCGRKPGYCPQREVVIPEGIEVRRLWGRYLLVPPKSGEPRTFPLLPAMVEMLEQHIDGLGGRAEPYGLLWPDMEGNPVAPRDDQEQWKQLLADAKVTREGATTHWARHTAISDLTAAGVPERVTGEIVGHKSPGITGRYQHVSSLDASNAMVKLGERRSPSDEETLIKE